MTDKDDLLKPLLDEEHVYDFKLKKFVAARPHIMPVDGENAAQESEETAIRGRVRSMSALTDENEFNK